MDLLKRSITFLGAVALVLAVYFGGPGQQPEEPVETGLPPELAEEPDVYLKNATITEFEASGARKYALFATRMDRFDEDALTRLVAPELNMDNPAAEPWDMRAERGMITRKPGEGHDVVVLNDNVELEQLDPLTGLTRLSIRSDMLEVYPHRQYAQTDQDVMIDTEVGRTLASGMQGNLKTGQLSLSSDPVQPVHTIVLPQQFKEQQTTD